MRWVVPFLLLAFFGLYSVPDVAQAQTLPTLHCPERVDEGSAFAVRIAWDRPYRSAHLEWQGREIDLAPEEQGRAFVATALLGMGLQENMAGAVFPVRVLVDDGGQPHFLNCGVERVEGDFTVQRLTVDNRYVEISQEDLARHRKEKQRIDKALATISPARLWSCPFERPVPGEITSPFGLRRVFNDVPKKPHTGVDLDGDMGQDVTAAMGGIVLLAEEYFFAGKSVYIDHGQGVVSLYLHLSHIGVTPGEPLLAGDVIGQVGESGRVTGPHLHFGVSILGQLVDPLTIGRAMCP